MSFKEQVEIDAISASDQNSKMPFLRNEFLNFFLDFYNDVFLEDESYLWSNEELKLKLKTWIWRLRHFEISWLYKF